MAVFTNILKKFHIDSLLQKYYFKGILTVVLKICALCFVEAKAGNNRRERCLFHFNPEN